MNGIAWFPSVITKHYADFGGRARRAEFWWYMLVLVAINVVLAVTQSLVHTKVLTGLFGLLTFAPSLGVECRRLHDIGKSGWWLLVSFVPLIGGLLLLYWFAKAGTAGPNDFGPDPKAAGATSLA